MILTDGIFRVRFRDGYERPRPVDPDEGPFEITVTPFATANRFLRGHRLRLDISSSNFPKYDVNPNTGEPAGRTRRTQIALNRIHLGGAAQNFLEIMALGHVELDVAQPRGSRARTGAARMVWSPRPGRAATG